jgi:predicted unusual protein kinase regulating ubiquinone biosynthesis (AarF/ABC1/UbiB family)
MVFRANLRRLIYIVTVIVRHAVAQSVHMLLTRWPRLAFSAKFARNSGPERLRLFFEELGGTFIKFGQMLALQPDILSLEYCNALFDLLDRCAPFSYAQLERIFIDETGKTPSEIFDSFEMQPLATASIGQVHVGYLRGRKVAIKVQRPNVDTDFAGDIRLMMATIQLIKRLRLRFVYWMIEPVSEFVGWTREELDYRYEARYMEQLRSNSRDNLHERVPEVIREYTTRRILVTEFFEGDTVLAYLRALESNDELMIHRLKSSGFDAHQLARHIIDNFLGDAFQHGIFHADLHPANLMILPGNVVGYVDFGITGVISRYSRQNLVALTLAYTRGDLDGMCEAFFNVSAIDRESDVQKFRNGLKRLADGWYEMRGKQRRLRKNFTLVMVDMLKLSRATSVWPERDVIKYIRSSIAIDGLITRFAPGFDVGRHLEVVCNSYLQWQMRKSLFSYSTLVGWATSGEHMIRDGAFRAASFLHRIAAGEMRIGGDASGAGMEADRVKHRKTVQLGAVVLGVSLLIAVTGERVQLGVNVFTAEVVLMASATMMLLRTIRRLSDAG